MRGAKGVVTVDFDAAGDFVLDSKAVGVDGAILGGAVGGAADVGWLRAGGVAGAACWDRGCGGRRCWCYNRRGAGW